MSEPGWIVANLDEESRLSGVALTRRASERSAALAPLLAAFARDGDVVRLPAPLPDAEAVPGATVLDGDTTLSHDFPDVTFVTTDPPSGAPLLPWMESRTWRRRPRPPAGDTWLDRLWACPPASPDAVARVHGKGFLAVFDRGPLFASARLADTVAETRAWLRAQPGDWVAKAPYSAAGRHRLLGRGGHDDEAATQVVRLLERHGALWLEPWVTRTLDVGACALVTSDGIEIVGAHRNVVDARGRFRGIALEPELPLTDVERRVLEGTVRHVAERIREEGYLGPIGIDAFRYRQGGGEHFQPLGEVNARLTFGFVAHALALRSGRTAMTLDVATLPGQKV